MNSLGTESSVFMQYAYLFILLCPLSATVIQPPCRSSLGMRKQQISPALTFDLWASSGDAGGAKLDSDIPWEPRRLGEDFLLIKASQPVVLTAVQSQGRPNSEDRVTGWTLETSFDCENYRAENYTSGPQTVDGRFITDLKHPEFASCIRIWPNTYVGESPALRLDLLGCVISNGRSGCSRDEEFENFAVTNGRQITFVHERIIAWIKVRLSLREPWRQGTTSAYYSRSCEGDDWIYLEPSTVDTALETDSVEDNSVWILQELEVPVRAKCLRVISDPSSSVEEIVTNECSASVLPTVFEIDAFNKGENATQHRGYYQDLNTGDNETLSLEQQVAGIFDESSEGGETQSKQAESPQTSSYESIQSGQVEQASHTGFFWHQLVSNYSEERRVFHLGEDSIPSWNSSDDNVSTIFKESVSESITVEESLDNGEYVALSSGAFRGGSAESVSDIFNISDLFLSSSTDDKEQQSHPESSSQHAANAQLTSYPLKKFEETPGSSPDESVAEEISLIKDHSNFNKPPLHLVKNDGTSLDCGVTTHRKGSRRKRVVSGKQNQPGQWPWLVSLHYFPETNFTKESGYKHLCGGTLVAPQWVMTAAHCFENMVLDGLANITDWEVKLGIVDLEGELDSPGSQQDRLIQSLYKHPNFRPNGHGLIYESWDIALLKLDRAVRLSKTVSPICLQDIAHDHEMDCFVSGWGKITKDSPGARFAHAAVVRTMSASHCNASFEGLEDDHQAKLYFSRIDDTILCVQIGSAGEDSCQGDSGGPLMCEREGRWHQAGIVSAGYECGSPGVPTIYTRVSQFVDWIKTTMAEGSHDKAETERESGSGSSGTRSHF